jgi:hypothetical protein
LANLFGVKQVVAKHEGPKELQRVLQQLMDGGSSAIA